MDIVLERVGHEATKHPYPRLPHVLVVVAAQHFLDELVEIAVMAEHDMSAMVPDKAVFIGVTGGKSADMIFALEDLPVLVTEFGETIGCAKPRGSGSDNDYFLVHADRTI